MIFISNTHKNENDIKSEFAEYEVSITECVKSVNSKRSMTSELIESVLIADTLFMKKRVFFFYESNLLSNLQIHDLFLRYYDFENPNNQKDIYLLDCSNEQIKFVKDNFERYEYKFYNMDNSKEKNLFFTTLKQILALSVNRDSIIDYENSDIPISYITKFISYNCIQEKDVNTLLNNLNLLIDLGKYTYKADEEVIHKLLNDVFVPVVTHTIEFPPKNTQKKEKNKNNEDEMRLVSEREANKLASTEFKEKMLGKQKIIQQDSDVLF